MNQYRHSLDRLNVINDSSKKDMNQSTHINSFLYHQQRFYTNNEGLNGKPEPDEIAQRQGIVCIMQVCLVMNLSG